jgi:antitoxin VapB
MITAKVFQSGNSQAIRLPKEFRLNSNKVFIKKIGDNIIISENISWETLINSVDNFTDDFMNERTNLPESKRDPL